MKSQGYPKQQMIFKIPKPTAVRLENEARARNTTMTFLVVEALKYFFQEGGVDRLFKQER